MAYSFYEDLGKQRRKKTKYKKYKKRVLEMRVSGPLLVYKVLNQFLILLH